jgi:hypothetical protein
MSLFPKFFKSHRLATGFTYLIGNDNKTRVVRLVRSTDRGFNFQSVKTGKNLLKKHLYPNEIQRDVKDGEELTFWLPEYLKVYKIHSDLDAFIMFLRKEGYKIVMKNPRHVPGQGYSAPEYYGDVDIDYALKEFISKQSNKSK